MGGGWKSIENLANRFGIWFTAFTAMTGIFGWIASHLIFLRPYGWAEAAFVGLFAALGVVLVLSIGLIALHLFRPLKPDPASTTAAIVPAKKAMPEPELKARLEQRIDLLQQFQTQKIDRLAETVAGIQNQIAIDLPNASTVVEAFRNLDDATELKIRQISQEIQRYSEKLQTLNLDTLNLLTFATDQATLAVLEQQIADGNRLEIPLGPDVQLVRRNQRFGDVEEYVRDVQSAYYNTHRGLTVANIIYNAEGEVDRQLQDTSQRPSHLDLLDYRRLQIAETKRVRLLAFLIQQREEKRCEIQRQRGTLIDKLSARGSG
jgi:hypothetical protein